MPYQYWAILFLSDYFTITKFTVVGEYGALVASIRLIVWIVLRVDDYPVQHWIVSWDDISDIVEFWGRI